MSTDAEQTTDDSGADHTGDNHHEDGAVSPGRSLTGGIAAIVLAVCCVRR